MHLLIPLALIVYSLQHHRSPWPVKIAITPPPIYLLSLFDSNDSNSCILDQIPLQKFDIRIFSLVLLSFFPSLLFSKNVFSQEFSTPSPDFFLLHRCFFHFVPFFFLVNFFTKTTPPLLFEWETATTTNNMNNNINKWRENYSIKKWCPERAASNYRSKTCLPKI